MIFWKPVRTEVPSSTVGPGTNSSIPINPSIGPHEDKKLEKSETKQRWAGGYLDCVVGPSNLQLGWKRNSYTTILLQYLFERYFSKFLLRTTSYTCFVVPNYIH